MTIVAAMNMAVCFSVSMNKHTVYPTRAIKVPMNYDAFGKGTDKTAVRHLHI